MMKHTVSVEQFDFTNAVIISRNGDFLIFHFISVKDIAVGGESSGRRFIEAVNYSVMQDGTAFAAYSFDGKRKTAYFLRGDLSVSVNIAVEHGSKDTVLS